MADKSTAAELIDALLAGGEPVDEGSFSLDFASAAAKLDAYQYPDRSAYLIPIAEAAVGLGARRVCVTTRGADLEIALEGVELREPDRFLRDPFAPAVRAEAEHANRALGRLGVGLHMALGHASIQRIAVSYSTDSETLVGEYGRDATIRLARRGLGTPGELRLLIDRPWAERLSASETGIEELAKLRTAVLHSRCEFRIDGLTVSRCDRDWDYVDRGGGPAFRWDAGLQRSGEEPSVIELWSSDVRIDAVSHSSRGFRAVVRLELPRRDLSQMRIIHDETVTAALAAVDAAHGKALLALAEDDAKWADSERPSHWPHARVDRVLGREPRIHSAPIGGSEPSPARRSEHPIVYTLFGSFWLVAGTGAGMIAVRSLIHFEPISLFPLALALMFVHSGVSMIVEALFKTDTAYTVLCAISGVVSVVGGIVVE